MPTQHGATPRALGSIAVVISLVAAALVVPIVSGVVPTAAAAGTPDVQLTRAVAASSLYGVDVPVTLTAHQNSTPDQDAFNLTFTDIIPPHTSFGSGAIVPSQTIALPDGSTELVWPNVADLLDNVSYALSYQLHYDPAFFDVPQTIGGTADAYVNTEATTVPKVSATGVASGFTGSGEATSATTLVPFLVTKSEPSVEGELLRGVHDHITTYTITVTNNAVKPTNSLRVSDFLAAGLEFLGCTAGDTSATGTEEYPGSGRIPTIAAVPNCNAGFTAETKTVDPDGAGPLTSGVYTEVAWTGLGTLPVKGVLTLSYAAAIPMHENVVAPGVSAVGNLDNNTGATTTDEESLVNYVGVTGFYDAADVTVQAKTAVTAEDVLIHKTVDKNTIHDGQTSTWSLDIQSSEYTSSTAGITVTDTIPDGLDYLAGSATPAMIGAPVTNPNGTLTASWLLPGFTAVNSDTTISYQTTTRAAYRASGAAVSSNDSWDNTVHLAAAAQVIDSTGTPQLENVIDDSHATQTAPGVDMKKEVASPADLSGGCTNALTWNDTTAGDFHPGDTVCYRLTVSYPALVRTLGTTMTDYLPAGMGFVSAVPTAASDVSGLTFTQPSAGVLKWVDGGPFIGEGSTFQVIVTTTIADPLAVVASDITSNLFKLRYRNTDNTTFQLRDLADIVWNEPALVIDKKITSINGVTITPTAQKNVQAGDSMGYTVTVSNAGKQRADNVSVRDLLPAGWDCASVTDLGGGTCSAGAIDWTIPSVVAASSATPSVPGTASVSYAGTTPAGSAPGDLYINTVGVRKYDGATNSGGIFGYVPKNNIDPTLESSANVPAASANATAEADVSLPAVVKTLATGVTEAGNNAANQATIGETATYSVTTTIPQGTTMYASPTITDAIAATLAIQGTPTFSINGGPAQNATVSGQNITAPLTTSPATSY